MRSGRPHENLESVLDGIDHGTVFEPSDDFTLLHLGEILAVFVRDAFSSSIHVLAHFDSSANWRQTVLFANHNVVLRQIASRYVVLPRRSIQREASNGAPKTSSTASASSANSG